MNYSVEVNEVAPAYEQVCSTVDWALPTGERLTGPLVVGIYPDEEDPSIFLTQEYGTVQFPASLLPTIIKQLKRAAVIAKPEESK